MIKALLENRLGQAITRKEFEEIMDMVTDDIKANRIRFKKNTSLDELLAIAESAARILKRCA